MDDKEIVFMSATEMVKRFRTRELSPVEVTEVFLARIEKLNPELQAYCTLTPELARENAKTAENAYLRGAEAGLLGGVPVSIKDLVLTKGIRTTRGSLLYKDFVPEESAPLAERIFASGAVMLGKTNTPEYGWRGTTDNKVFGVTRNPWNRAMTPGGSSGGSAAQVAAGLAPLALGTDGGGSIRIPASFAGIYGLKPTTGRVPVFPVSASGDLSHAGPMTRTVDDAAIFLNALTGWDYRDRTTLPKEEVDYLRACQEGRANGLKGLKVAWSADLGYNTPVEPEVLEKTKSAARRFAELGAEVVEVTPDAPFPGQAFQIIWFVGLAAMLGYAANDPEKAELLDSGLLAGIKEGFKISGVDYAKAQLIDRPDFCAKFNKFFEEYDLLLTPTVPVTAFEIGLYAPKQIAGVAMDELRLGWTPFTFPINLTGQPAASVPCGFDSNGLPIGLQIIGKRYDDYGVLKASAAFESIQPWGGYYPTVA
jgi:aspartyl-tRNA(Asn)/glutamyl-tRNA(Gln) amidotransferase subunit A